MVFVLMYKPQKEKFTQAPIKPPKTPSTNQDEVTITQEKDNCCSNLDYMANNYRQCRNVHYEGIQFANPDYGCPEKVPETYLGAIIGN